MSVTIEWYGVPSPEIRARPEKNRPRERRGTLVRGGLRRQRLDTHHRALGPVSTFAVLRVEHDHPDGQPYLLIVEQTAQGWRAVHEVGSVADALRCLSGEYMRSV